MKAVMISIQPKWVAKIVEREKTVEVRKTRPKLKPPFKCYIYETKNIERIFPKIGDLHWFGRVIGECICDEITQFENSWFDKGFIYAMRDGRIFAEDLAIYLGDKDGYSWHISDLKIYDKPKKLSEFYKSCSFNCKCMFCKYHSWGNMFEPPSCNYEFEEITRPPQSWCYVEEI